MSRRQRVSNFKQTHKFADCTECGLNLRKWGLGATNGATCPPCVQEIRRKDMEERAVSKKALFIPVDGEIEIIDISQAGDKIGDTMCNIYHSEFAYKDTRPIYEMRADDKFIGKGLPTNYQAGRIAGIMGVFHADSDICGPIVATGPCGMGLLDTEIKLFLRS
jgi:hypothetical protein